MRDEGWGEITANDTRILVRRGSDDVLGRAALKALDVVDQLVPEGLHCLLARPAHMGSDDHVRPLENRPEGMNVARRLAICVRSVSSHLSVTEATHPA